MRLTLLMLSVVGTAGAAFGQTTSTPRDPADRRAAQSERRAADRPRPVAPAQPAPPPPGRDAVREPAQGVPGMLRGSGNSLLRSSLAAPRDPSRARIEDVSLIAVPAPEPKIIRKHDLVTIIVREESEYSSEGSSELTREARLEAAIDEFVKLRLGNAELEGGGIGPVAPRLDLSGSREFSGEGTVDRTDSFTARVTAEVLDVKPNGTLVLQARKRIKTDEEEQVFVLSGTCRAEDISADNTILSTQLHDQELTKTHKGTVRNATRRGWGGRLLDAISPF
jgi:flagellar L-ring protein precursor FlgH